MEYWTKLGEKSEIKILVTGGQANAGPPLGPALGPLGLNVMSVVNEINSKTADFPGMKVPVKIVADTETKTFEVEVGLPPTSALLLKAASIEKGSGSAAETYVGDLTKEQIVGVAKSKLQQSYATTIKSAVKEVLGTCVSMGITIEGKNPRETFSDVSEGNWDDILSKEDN